MLPPAQDPLTATWLALAALRAGDFHQALAGLRTRLRSRYEAPAAFCTAGGTDALTLAFRTAFRERGENTLALPAYGCYALATAAVGADARILFYDLDPETLSPDEDSLRSVLEQGAQTVAVAHFYGYPTAMEQIVTLAHRHGAVVVEDAAQAGGGTLNGAPLGSFGDLTVFSFGRGKGATCGGGGALLVRDMELVESFRREVREVLGSDGPSRGRGWKELGLATAQWAFGRPYFFRIPSSILALGLGETRYQEPVPPAAMSARAAILLRESLGVGMGGAVLARQRKAHALAARLEGIPGVALIRPVPGALPGALRFPVLLPRGPKATGGEPSLGIVPGYPGLLPELKATLTRTVNRGPVPFPGAREVMLRLHTLPTHAWVRTRDMNAIVDWVEGCAVPVPSQRRSAARRPVEAGAAGGHSRVRGLATVQESREPEPETTMPPPFPEPAEPRGLSTVSGPPAQAEETDTVDILEFWRTQAGSPNGNGAWDATASGHRRQQREAHTHRALPWDLLMAAVVVFVLTSVARVHLLFPILKPLHPTQVAAIAAVILFAINYHPARRLVTIGSPVSTFLLVLMGWMAMTVPFALRGYGSFMFLVTDFSKTALLFFLIVGGVRAIRDVERLAYAYFLGAALYAGVVMARFSLGNSWRLSNLITYDANDFALFAVTAIPLGIYFLGEAGGGIVRRIGTGIALAAVAVAFVQAGSRGGFLALLVVLVFLLLRHRAISVRWRVAGMGLLLLTLFTASSGTYWDQMSTMLTPSSDYNLTAETGRLQIWKRGMGYLQQRPMFGVGPDNFPVAEGVLSPLADRQDYGIGVIWTSPHNAFVQVAVELGVPGFLIFLSFLGSIFLLLHRLSRSHEGKRGRRGAPGGRSDRPGLAQALTGSLLGFVVGAFFLSLAYSAMLLTLAGLAGALWKTTRVGPDQKTGHRPIHPTRLRRTAPEEVDFMTVASGVPR